MTWFLVGGFVLFVLAFVIALCKSAARNPPENLVMVDFQREQRMRELSSMQACWTRDLYERKD